ncbi:RNA polymerase sigma factor, sigma-70 family [Clostridium sp. DSM 8431]|uniref:sigma-70 family RNA polymerase sigma factor n=1 Tax=Clostridium sp. DSM 8431 TaxID=1761781 RepID=UPI0008DF264D|nr:sigma-70 family RNA polymerase sigma factor [Clostridium sp. DSM 8431]SFU83232.1 RNA polymerase sigma factor, sigma-70 family [Clostridium sp. DSM 8431]
MNYKYIESLVLSAKDGDEVSKEKLVEEFSPLIKALSHKTHLSTYTTEDLINECYISLFKCIKLYNPKNHRFVAYATNAIKNNLNYLIRRNLMHREITSQDALTSTGSLDHLNLATNENIEDSILYSCTKKFIFDNIQSLTNEEKEFLIHVQIRKRTLKSYAELKGISTSKAHKTKVCILKKISELLESNNK